MLKRSWGKSGYAIRTIFPLHAGNDHDNVELRVTRSLEPE